MKGIISFAKFIFALVVMYMMFYHYDEVLYEAERIIRSLSSSLISTIKNTIR